MIIVMIIIITIMIILLLIIIIMIIIVMSIVPEILFSLSVVGVPAQLPHVPRGRPGVHHQ